MNYTPTAAELQSSGFYLASEPPAHPLLDTLQVYINLTRRNHKQIVLVGTAPDTCVEFWEQPTSSERFLRKLTTAFTDRTSFLAALNRADW
jgi:hypothetical protein